MRDFFRPARLGGGGSGIKLSLLAQSGPKRGISGVPGEFCTGWARRGRVLGEFCTGWARWAACRESFVPAPASRAVQSSPCVACYWREREKILPACGKWAEIGVFVCAGRVLYRLGLPGLPVGRVLYRWRLRGVALGIVASRLWEPRGLQPGLQAAWMHPFRWHSA